MSEIIQFPGVPAFVRHQWPAAGSPKSNATEAATKVAQAIALLQKISDASKTPVAREAADAALNDALSLYIDTCNIRDRL